MRVLFDHNVPDKLRRSLVGHDVFTADEMLWAQIDNGRLLRATEDAGFEVMVTADQNLSYQQNLSGRKLDLVLLSTNDWKIIQRHTEPILSAVEAATPGSFQTVTIPPIESP